MILLPRPAAQQRLAQSSITQGLDPRLTPDFEERELMALWMQASKACRKNGRSRHWNLRVLLRAFGRRFP